MTAPVGGAAVRRPLRVLESFRAPRATTNPYLVLLLRSLPGDVEVTAFTWRAALLEPYDVLHLHWPEVVLERRSVVRSLGAALLLVLVLVRCRLTRTAVVRTAHNLRPHEQHLPWTRAVLRLCDRWTTWWIRLNDTTPTPAGAPVTTIVHGHYRDWFADVAPSRPVPGRLVCFGLIRPYKGVERLLEILASVPEEPLTLRVTGRPTTQVVATELRAAAEADPRVGLRLEHVPDLDLAHEIGQAELVVLPYREMHNSGALLLALSLDRPVLVLGNDVTDALAAEVGRDWVIRFRETLDAAALLAAVEAVRGGHLGRPDLHLREWPTLGIQHADVFQSAWRLRGGRAARQG